MSACPHGLIKCHTQSFSNSPSNCPENQAACPQQHNLRPDTVALRQIAPRPPRVACPTARAYIGRLVVVDRSPIRSSSAERPRAQCVTLPCSPLARVARGLIRLRCAACCVDHCVVHCMYWYSRDPKAPADRLASVVRCPSQVSVGLAPGRGDRSIGDSRDVEKSTGAPVGGIHAEQAM